MDKIATNNFIVGLRKDAKASKSMVGGNLARKISDLKKAIEKGDDKIKKETAEEKIQNLHTDIRKLKTLDVNMICKRAILKPNAKYWNDLLSDSRASSEEKLIARVISKGRIQKKVASFRTDHEDCDEWIEEYFEFREKKRELTEFKHAKRKTKSNNGVDGLTKRVDNKMPMGKPKFNTRKNKNNHHPNSGKHLKSRQRSGVNEQKETLHPSWASKRKEKELLKAALSGGAAQHSKRIILNSA